MQTDMLASPLLREPTLYIYHTGNNVRSTCFLLQRVLLVSRKYGKAHNTKKRNTSQRDGDSWIIEENLSIRQSEPRSFLKLVRILSHGTQIQARFPFSPFCIKNASWSPCRVRTSSMTTR
mmetsp:Transcript_16341/g.29889  ORF Transcript_16341/g.29889 Transcript_16341/m.29889 type:complete len:120 (-) Transcript_16341:1147-1506(-)